MVGRDSAQSGIKTFEFLTWGNTVVKNGGGALATRLSAARFLHHVEVRGGFGRIPFVSER